MTVPSPRSVAVIGAGAAGLMAAIHAARAGARVVLLERTPDGGRKILISGGGRCNILPAELDPSRFVSESPAPLLRRLVGSWPLAAQRSFFETDLRLPLALEPETGKLFPVSNRARHVRDALVAAAATAGAEIRCGARVTGVEPGPHGWRITLESRESLPAVAVVVGTGGLSVPATGSDGFGLDLARRLGHLMRETYPALTPLTADPPVHAALAGLSLPVTLSARAAGRRITTRGGFLFTHHGYSGPAVLDISHLAVRSRLRGDDPRQSIRVRWTEADRDTWDRRLQLRSPQSVLAALRESLPGRLAERLIAEAEVAPGRQLAQLARGERRQLVARLADYDLPWTGDEGYRKAEVTGGGMALEELDPRTLESRRHPGLYFCGEVLDAFGPIGGYNFAWAWATGRAAGIGAARGCDTG